MIALLAATLPVAAQDPEPTTLYPCGATALYENSDPHPLVPCGGEDPNTGSCEPGEGAEGIGQCQKFDHFGSYLAVGRDWDGDGQPDLAVGGLNKETTANAREDVWLYLGTSTTPTIIFEGNGRTDLFGSALAFAPDMNGDGRAELVVGAPRWDFQQDPNDPVVDEPVGRVYVFFGLEDGTYVEGERRDAETCAGIILEGTVIGGRFGASVAAGRIDADTLTDILVGSPGSELSDQLFATYGPPYAGVPMGYPGEVYLFAGDPYWVTGSNQGGNPPCNLPLLKMAGTASLLLSGDLPDPTADPPEPQTHDRFGHAIALIGNIVPGSPGAEFIVGAPQAWGNILDGFEFTGPGYARVFSPNGTQQHEFTGTQQTIVGGVVTEAEAFGWSVAGNGQLDVDSVNDILVGAFLYDAFDQMRIIDAGRVWAYSGADFTPLEAYLNPDPLIDDTALVGLQPQSNFGHSVSAVTDVLGDGLDDILVGAETEVSSENMMPPCPGSPPPPQGGRLAGAAYVVDSAGSAGVDLLRYRLIGERSRDRVGFAVAGWDLDGNGRGDLISGGMAWSDPAEEADDCSTRKEVGRVYRYDGLDIQAAGGP